MKRYFCVLTYLWLLLALPLFADTTRIYVPNSAGSTIDVIDPATNKVVQVIAGIVAPMAAHFSPDGSRIYITTYGEDVLDVIDRKTGEYIKKVPLSGHGDDLAVTKDGRLALVCIGNMTGSENTGALDIIDTTSLEKVKTIPIDRGLHDIVATQDSKYAVVGSSNRLGGDIATVVDLQSKQPAWEIKFPGQGVQPLAMESNPDGSGRRLFIQLHGLYGFVAVDFATHKEVARVMLPDEPREFAHTGPEPSHGLEVAPDGKTLWVDSTDANALFVYSLPELKLQGQVALPVLKLPGKAPIGAFPNWLTFTPDSKTVYVSDSSIRAVSAIDVKSMKEVAFISVGEVPKRISTLVVPGQDLAIDTSIPSGAQSPGSPAQAASTAPPLDYEFFKTRVEPIFLKTRSENHARCYSCHERYKHPKGFHLEALSPGSSFWTEEQSRKNFQVLSQLVVPGKPLSGLFPFRPLAPEAGGDAVHIHGGGRQFASQDDPDWQTFAQWVRGEKVSGSTGP
jgi:YVTN family beta-propeller protein